MLKKYIVKISSNNEHKVVVQNFAYLTLLQIAGYIFPLITMPYLARVIGLVGFGKVAFANAVVVWLMTIVDWGFNYTATRDTAQNRQDFRLVSEIFSNVLWARCVLTIISFLLLILLIIFIPPFSENKDILLVSFLIIIGHILFPDWFFQAMERMRYITILNIISKVIFTIAIFFFIKEEEDYILHPLFVSCGYFVSALIAFYYILVKWRIKIMCPQVRNICQTIKKSFDVFLNNLMPNLYNSFSVVLLGFLGGNVANGKFDAGSKFVGIAQQFIQVLSRAFFPFLSRHLDKHSVYARLNLILSLIISTILFVTAPLIIDVFFTDEFTDSILILQILSFSIFFLSLSNIYGTNYMIIEGKEKQLRNITAIVSVIGFVLSFPLVILWGHIGVAITILLTRAILGGSIYLRAIKIKNNNKKKTYTTSF